jgi:hypothetical protein
MEVETAMQEPTVMRTEGEASEAFSKVPPHTREALRMYVEQHIEPGSFLRAVLENNLCESFAKADMHNRYALFDICNYVYNWTPMNCWGSRKAVREWLNSR